MPHDASAVARLSGVERRKLRRGVEPVMPDPPLVRRVVLRNYKSIAACDVRPGPLTFLVGPNGAGKSNFLDALRLVAESLRLTLDHALHERGGIKEVRRRSSGHPTHFGIRIDFKITGATGGYYAFEVGSRPRGGYAVREERCHISGDSPGTPPSSYTVRAGQVVESSVPKPPPAARDRLYLVNVSGFEEFRPLYDALSGMGFYNLIPERCRDLQPSDPGELLTRDGGNIASVLSNLGARSPDLKKRIEEYLAQVVPGLSGVDPVSIGTKETLEFRQEVRGSQNPRRFPAVSMSDGTLRALGVLVALFQHASSDGARGRLIGIEEPEVALHPAASGVLTDGLRDASVRVQVLVTSHSPDLLDDKSISDECILAVTAEHGETRIGPLDAAGRSSLREHLYTAGELLRMDQLRPDPKVTNLKPQQLSLFGPKD
jgi:predicted ATPase